MFKPGKHVLHMKSANSAEEFFLVSAELAVRCADILQAGVSECVDDSKYIPFHLSACNGPDGKAFAYMLSRELWNLVRWDLKAGEDELNLKAGNVVKEPLKDFESFMSHWDFRYDYDPSVTCPVCGNETEDWRADPFHPFMLANANIGGLLVFHCVECGSTIRKMHFKDHVACECVPNKRYVKP